MVNLVFKGEVLGSGWGRKERPRHMGETRMNRASSCLHSIFRMHGSGWGSRSGIHAERGFHKGKTLMTKASLLTFHICAVSGLKHL